MARKLRNKLYLYDPRTNVSTETDYEYISELTGIKRISLQSYKSRQTRIDSIGCYIIGGETPLTVRQSLYSKEKFMGEKWMDIEGENNDYLISNHGRFKRIYKHVEPRFIMPFFKKQNGHLYVKVRFNGVYKMYKISHLVSHHFCGPNNKQLSVRHKNGIKIDCFAGNLEYITKEQLGRITGALSTSKPVIQLDVVTMDPIEEYRSVREAGRKTFMSYQAVLDSCHGKTKEAAGKYKFMFLDEYEIGELA